jgi:hypothetical protein
MDSKEKRNRLVILFVGAIIIVLAVSLFPSFRSLKIQKPIDIAGLFWGTATILAIVERSTELFISAWRDPQKKNLEREVKLSQEAIFQSLPQTTQDELSDIKIEIDKTIENINKIKLEKVINENTFKRKQDELNKRQENGETGIELNTIQAVIDSLQQNDQQLNNDKDAEEIKLQNLENKHLSKLLANPILLNYPSPAASTLTTNLKKLDNYIEDTAFYSLILGIGIGLFCSIAGIRILEPLVDLTELLTSKTELARQQLEIFQKVDILVSALGISGGSKLFHGLPALISDTLSSTRNLVNKQ